MGMRARFSVTGDLGYPGYTPELGIPVDYSEGCEVFADVWEDIAKDLVPVDTGYLQSTLHANANSNGCVCETDCDYSQYVEYGTVKMGAQPYFEPAIDMALAEASMVWQEAWQEALRDEQEQLEAMEEASRHREGGNRWRENQEYQQAGLGRFAAQIGGSILAGIVLGFFNVLMDIMFGGDDYKSEGAEHHHADRGGYDEDVGGGRIDVEIF